MGKSTRIVKRASALFLVVLMNINTMAAVVSENDGSAFITKAEFDSLKNNFQSQLDKYNTSIDSKIDGAIASYLAGISVKKSGTINASNDGLFWSIGYFDRPRHKHGIPLYNFVGLRTAYVVSGGLPAGNYGLYESTWGTPFVSRRCAAGENKWTYTDIMINNYDATNRTAVMTNIYKDNLHLWETWDYNQLSTFYNDDTIKVPEDMVIHGGENSQQFWVDHGAMSSLAFRPIRSDSVVPIANPNVYPSSSKYGLRTAASIVVGKRMLWDNKLVVFGPISYNCFNHPVNDEQYMSGTNDWDIRDEKLYNTRPVDISDLQYQRIIYDRKNFFYDMYYDSDNPTNNPWNLTEIEGATGKAQAVGYAASGSPVTWSLLQRNYKFKIGYGHCGWTMPSTGVAPYKDVRDWTTWDVRFDRLGNWTNVGKTIETSTLNLIDSTSNALLKNNDDTIFSLAGGLQVCTLEKNRNVTVKGSFRKDCGYSYVTDNNVLNEGVVDDTDAYVIYAKIDPFDITRLPEDENDLIDISPDVKDTANVGKLAKCLIVRDGNFSFNVLNDTKEDKIVFIKWEKLSNWDTIGVDRKTALATDTDIRDYGTNNTITPPTWTYFGGGYLKLKKSFNYVEID